MVGVRQFDENEMIATALDVFWRKGLHDATMATRFFAATGQPVLVLPYTYCGLMLVGLLRSRRGVFAAPVATATPESTSRRPA